MERWYKNPMRSVTESGSAWADSSSTFALLIRSWIVCGCNVIPTRVTVRGACGAIRYHVGVSFQPLWEHRYGVKGDLERRRGVLQQLPP